MSVAESAGLLPKNSWDSHIHIIDPERYAMDPYRDYTPKAATVKNATEWQHQHNITHSVIVLPSVYGTNNSVLLDALEAFKGTARGVCVVDPDKVTNETIAQYHAAGVRGVRVNTGNEGINEEIVALVKKNARIAALHNWALQLWIPIRAFKELGDVIPTLGVRVVVDHYGHAMVGSRTGNYSDTIDPYTIEGFPELIKLIQQKHVFVKLSAPYQNSKLAPLYEDMRVVADVIMANGPDMVVFGSDWPHTASKEGNAAAGGRLSPQEFRKIDDAGLIAQTVRWAGSEQQVQRLFVDNPRRLWQYYENETLS
ncbi:amidohydrolase family protein [Pyrenochaeta sp. DS3sAY3a]|nr:amidohydrolase family protein [Pyrenochaeta sp. DS3sAY3a]